MKFKTKLSTTVSLGSLIALLGIISQSIVAPQIQAIHIMPELYSELISSIDLDQDGIEDSLDAKINLRLQILNDTTTYEHQFSQR